MDIVTVKHNIKLTRNELTSKLKSLPADWPQELIFENPPTPESPRYSAPENSQQPNEGLCRLREDCAANHEFLQLQTWIASKIELYSLIAIREAKEIIEELSSAAQGLDDLKLVQWEAGRLVQTIDTTSVHPLETVLPPTALIAFAPLLLQTKGLSRQLAQFVLHLLYMLAFMILELSPSEKRRLTKELPGLPKTTEQILRPIVRPFDPIRRQQIPPATYNPNSGENFRHNMWSSELRRYLNGDPLVSAAQCLASSLKPADALRCTYQSTIGSNVCGTRLTAFSGDGSSSTDQGQLNMSYNHEDLGPTDEKPKPQISFYVADLRQWLTDLVARPGMVDILRNLPQAHGRVSDIMQSRGIRSLKGPDGRSFIGPHVTGVHICLAMFVDFFNSEGNFIGGKHNSTGGIFFIVLNLPISLRYLPENMFPIFTPGGREPTTEGLNNLLRPAIDQLITLYTHGIVLHYSNHPTLTIIRAMVAVIIADTPAAKKVGGFASHAHYWFCHICRLGRDEIETSSEPSSWPRLSHQEHDAIVKAWRDAPSLELRDELFRLYGLRFSELHRLPYIDLTTCIGAEPMHAIMQNTIQHHIRQTFGIDRVQGDRFFDTEVEGANENMELPENNLTELTLDTPELHRGIAICAKPWLDVRSLVMLVSLKTSTLVELCRKANVQTWNLPRHNGQPKRISMVEALASQTRAMGLSSEDVQEEINILSSDKHILEKTNKLHDVSVEKIFKICCFAGIDTNTLPMKKGSVYPDRDTMVHALLSHTGGYNNLKNIKEIIALWHFQAKMSTDDEPTVALDLNADQKNLPHFNELFLQEIWRDIEKTEFPGELENDRPPKYLGSKQHGRLKASQWRTVCCFTMLITLGRLWGHPNSSTNDKMWLKNYIHLAVLVRIAYSHSIDAGDIEAFKHHSIRYFEGLRAYHPSSIKPCHHFLLHIPEMMERFGPIRGWWAFPFERFNGQIQHLSTNHKVGEVEKSYLTQWLRLAKIRAVMSDNKHAGLDKLMKLANNDLDLNVLAADNRQQNILQVEPHSTGSSSLSRESRSAFVHHPALNLDNMTMVKKATVHNSVFESYRRSTKNGLVEFPGECANANFQPVGYIHEIFQVHGTAEQHTLLVACIAQCVDVQDQFLDNASELGARLCGREIARYVIIPVEKLSHVIRYPWSSSAQLIISIYNHPVPL
ncbi:hypothetical protein M408DRAFT_19943 [Serendipita vermifera MAFF 305830]|uniref:DUF4218 domain-containing protein n=1 Tax=Serendipita vermifera MAFF 305830 TaxID=933852 RepID=A0A0C2X2Q2_SERVB|nr:hypothetical protein M408DRAFT_19943 [Serendipita vermifera MAFF 305830]